MDSQKVNSENIDSSLKSNIESFGDFKQETIEKTYDGLAD